LALSLTHALKDSDNDKHEHMLDVEQYILTAKQTLQGDIKTGAANFNGLVSDEIICKLYHLFMDV